MVVQQTVFSTKRIQGSKNSEKYCIQDVNFLGLHHDLTCSRQKFCSSEMNC